MGNARPDSLFAYAVEEFDSNSAIYQSELPRLVSVASAPRLNSWQYLGVKRAIDIVVGTLMIVVCLLPGLFIAALIMLTSRGPVFYREVRIGKNGTPFRIWKFRSMQHLNVLHGQFDSVACPQSRSRWRTEKDVQDPRITPVGRFLRRCSLDELPQLFNVLRGEMSLVGPRPVVRAELPLYQHQLSFYLAATPGISGLWQVSGRSNINFPKRANLDALYVRSWSLLGDFVILARTVPAVLNRVGAR